MACKCAHCQLLASLLLSTTVVLNSHCLSLKLVVSYKYHLETQTETDLNACVAQSVLGTAQKPHVS